MNTNNHKTAALTDVINAIQGYFSFVLGQKKLFGLLMLSTALIAMVYGFLQSPKYEATSTFVVEEKSGSGGGLAGLASQFGFDMNSLSAAGAGLFYGDNILDILQSRRILTEVLLSRVDSSKGVNGPTLASHERNPFDVFRLRPGPAAQHPDQTLVADPPSPQRGPTSGPSACVFCQQH